MTRSGFALVSSNSPERNSIVETINQHIFFFRDYRQNLLFTGLLICVWLFPPIDIFEESWLPVVVDIIGMHIIEATQQSGANPDCIDYGLSDSCETVAVRNVSSSCSPNHL
jgi:hypothetical protein